MRSDGLLVAPRLVVRPRWVACLLLCQKLLDFYGIHTTYSFLILGLGGMPSSQFLYESLHFGYYAWMVLCSQT